MIFAAHRLNKIPAERQRMKVRVLPAAPYYRGLMTQRVYEYEAHYLVDLQVWQDMQPLYKMLGKESPPKPVLILSAKATEAQKWELE
jgi:hypothetical protein